MFTIKNRIYFIKRYIISIYNSLDFLRVYKGCPKIYARRNIARKRRFIIKN